MPEGKKANNISNEMGKNSKNTSEKQMNIRSYYE